MTQLVLKVVIIDLSIFKEKERKIKTNCSKNNHIATEKLEMRRPFAFSIFQNLDLMVNR